MEETAQAAHREAFMPGLFVIGSTGRPALIAGHCAQCGAYSFPSRNVCAACGPGPEVQKVMLGGAGKVYASTLVRTPSPVEIPSPYAYGYVDLDEAPLRVFALFDQAVCSAPAPGARVHLVVGLLGQDGLAYKFALGPAP
jgi:uncharacterized OB-fold protein